MTYHQLIISDLSSGVWVCGVDWLNRLMPTYSQRISEINARESGRIVSRVCQSHNYHRSTIHEYRDTRASGQMAWVS